MRAARVAEPLMAPLGRRWKHVQGVAQRARQYAAGLPEEEREAVVAGAWLHDIGYAPALALTGLHPLDGAVYLQEQGLPDLVVQLVAYHSGAEAEAEERGLLHRLTRFPLPPTPLLEVLTGADMTTSPDGAPVAARDRIAEILTRYEPDHPVHRAVTRSGPSLIETAERIQEQAVAGADGLVVSCDVDLELRVPVSASSDVQDHLEAVVRQRIQQAVDELNAGPLLPHGARVELLPSDA